MSATDTLKQFIASEDLLDITAAFASLLAFVPGYSSAPCQDRYPLIRDTLTQAGIPFISKRLFQQLDERWNLNATLRDKNATHPTVVVSGAGPCGLRTAVELAVLGFNVHLIEKRSEFSRHNILKTWVPTVDDLVALGFKSYFPMFKPHGAHCIGTREIQSCLLKTALLFGVTFIHGQAVGGLIDPSVALPNSPPGSWRVALDPSGHASHLKSLGGRSESPSMEEPEELALKPGEQDADRLDRTSKVDFFERATTQDGAILSQADQVSESAILLSMDHLIVAEGESSLLIRNLGFDRNVTRYGPGIGIVVNIKMDLNDPREKKLREFIHTKSYSKWQETCLGPLSQKGIDLENMEYLSFSTHFIVVTALRDSLVRFGVLRSGKRKVRDCLAADNIDFDKLREYARQLAIAAGIPETAPFADKHGVNIFDFSCKGKLIQTLRSLPPTSDDDLPHLVLPVGDTLLNPYWPQGLGVNRGTHSVLDAVWCLYRHHTVSPDDALKERNAARKIMDWYPMQESLILPGATWTADPLTRYQPSILKNIYNESLEHRRENGLTQRMLASIGRA